MKTNTILKTITLSAVFIIATSCGEDTTPYQSNSNSDNREPVDITKKSLSGSAKTNSEVEEGGHQVVLKEVLPARNYIYLLVEENNEEFWIATVKREVTIGNSYLFSNGLVQTNFQSKEHNRVFETITLVSNLIDFDPSKAKHSEPMAQEAPNTPSINIEVKNSIRIGDLVENSSKYTDKKIQVSGVIVKVNANIMNKNWVHLDDGSNDGYDLIITTNETLENGSTVTMTGIVRINKDFGAGYKFDVILEEGSVVAD